MTKSCILVCVTIGSVTMTASLTCGPWLAFFPNLLLTHTLPQPMEPSNIEAKTKYYTELELKSTQANLLEKTALIKTLENNLKAAEDKR